MEQPFSGQPGLDLLPDGVVIADASGGVAAVNRAACDMLSTTPELAAGRHVAEVVALQDQAGNDWFTCNRPYAGLRTRSSLTEQSWFREDGTELLVTARLHRDRADRSVTALAVSLRTARGRARLDRERSDLVATVAHELRSPLTGVKGFIATLLSKWDKLNDDQKKLMLTTVNSDADRLTRLIAELLDVARIDTGRLSLFPRPVDFEPAAARVVASVQAGTGRDIVLDAGPGLPKITVDPDKFTQVVTNLVDNAVRHGEGRVRVTAAPAAETDLPSGVVMHVDDEGDGISPEIRSRVFTKFWKHGVRGGSGLGMYIVHGLVTAHGGTVEITDAPTGGARITVLWPEHDRRAG